MPFHINWYLLHRVIEVRLEGDVSMDDMRTQTDLIRVMLDDAEHHAAGRRVFVLLDTLMVKTMPPAYLMLGQALPVLRYKNRGTVYHVTRSKTTRSILELTAHVMSFAVRAFASREEAMQVIDYMILQEDLTQDWC